MAAMALITSSLISCPNPIHQLKPNLLPRSLKQSPSLRKPERKQLVSRICCSTANKPDFRSTSRQRDPQVSHWQLIGALSNPSRAVGVPDILKGLGIDLAAVLLFAFLYTRENSAKNAQLEKLSREESLSNLRLRVNENKVIPVSALRGVARLVILVGPSSFLVESFKRSKPFTEALLDRAVLVVPFATDNGKPDFEFEEDDEPRKKRLWQLTPVYTSEWASWVEEQKKLANVPIDSPVYLSLRMDGRVRGSGVGYPPWNAFVAQLPPMKGMWSGILDGMDGRVL